jgi:hypothetical protein
MSTHIVLAAMVLLSLSVSLTHAQVTINHANFDPSGLPQSTLDAVGKQSAFFAHASVGGNLLGGITALHAADPGKYQLTAAADDATPPATLAPGRLYEYNRGNPAWSVKITSFETYMANGWGDKVDVALNKFCYIDPNADPTTYLTSMNTIESAYPQTTFIYMTMPLKTSAGNDGYLRQKFNEAVRAYCHDHNKVLYDLADIEAWNPAGQEQTALFNGYTCQTLYSGYTDDGGHLNTLGSQRAAQGLYSTLAAIAVPEPTAAATLVGGLLAAGLIPTRTPKR